MALAIITADQRMRSATVKGMVLGKAGVGKTTLIKSLDPATTLCLDVEGGMLSVQRDDRFGPAWRGDSIKIESWPEAKAVLEAFKAKHPAFTKYHSVFIDSISIASRMCFDWCKEQPEAFNKKGEKNNLGAYGLLGLEMPDWCWGWKHLDGVNVWLVGGLEQKEVLGVKEWVPLTTGSKLASELPFIMDCCLVMDRFKAADGNYYVGLFTDALKNPEYASVPVKTRIDGLDQIEPPHLGKLMAKAIGSSPQSAPPPSAATNQTGNDAHATPNHSEAA